MRWNLRQLGWRRGLLIAVAGGLVVGCVSATLWSNSLKAEEPGRKAKAAARAAAAKKLGRPINPAANPGAKAAMAQRGAAKEVAAKEDDTPKIQITPAGSKPVLLKPAQQRGGLERDRSGG